MSDRRGKAQPKRPVLSPAFEALLALVREEQPALLEERLLGLREDSPELLRLARAHGLLSLLYLRLEEHGLEATLPTEAWRWLSSAHLTLAARQTRMVAAGLEVIQALGAAGIRCLPLKGLALIATAWPDYLPRDMVDLDLLVAPEQLAAARAVLEGMGFACHGEGFVGCPWTPHPLKAARGDLGVDVHTAPWGRSAMEPRPLSFEQAWCASRQGALLDEPITVPCQEDLILVLLGGMARDRFYTFLRAWADLRWLLETPSAGACPTTLAQRAASLAARRLVDIALRFAQELEGGEMRQAPVGAGTSSAYQRCRPILWRRLLLEGGIVMVPRSVLRFLARGPGTSRDLEAAALAWIREHPEAFRRGGWARTRLALLTGALAYAGRLLVSGQVRQAVREEWCLLRAVREP